MPSLYDLAAQLQAFAEGSIDRGALDAWLTPVLAADPLDVAESDHVPWEDAADEERLFWRLAYLVETAESAEDGEADDALRALAARILACLASTASPSDTTELLPLVADQPRLGTILDRYRAGVVSRTGLLGVIANSGYPAHVKLWLQHADAAALERLTARMAAGEWGEVARMVERKP